MNKEQIKKILHRIDALVRERKDLSNGSDWNQGVFAGIEMVREEIVTLSQRG